MKRIQVKGIRKVFPRWPSEQDIAEVPANLAARAQEFHSAALVLAEENDRTIALLHAGGDVEMTEAILLRMHLNVPALFCLSFAIELALKAALLRDGKPATSHGLLALAKTLPGIALSSTEESALQVADYMVVDGKYVTPKKPDPEATAFFYPPFRSFYAQVEPLYRQFQARAMASPPNSAQ